jgi:hypothetical protein
VTARRGIAERRMQLVCGDQYCYDAADEHDIPIIK